MAGWRVIALGVLAIAPLYARAGEPSEAKGAEDVSLRTWAVLSSNVPDAALSDLANAELAGIDGIQLVEREKLESITDERIRGLLLSADIAERPKLGKMLKADALVLLSTESREGAPILRIVIVECAYGTRLSTVVLPYREDGLETAAKAVKKAVLDARRQTAGGIKLLVAVPHFLSKDFTHEFDHPAGRLRRRDRRHAVPDAGSRRRGIGRGGGDSQGAGDRRRRIGAAGAPP